MNDSIEQVFESIDAQYRMSPMLKLKGHITFKAAKLVGMYAAKMGKALMDATKAGTLGDNSLSADTFAEAMAVIRSEPDETFLIDAMGLETTDMWTQIRALVEYSNKLNFDLQELVDPTGKKRLQAEQNPKEFSLDARGVFFNEEQQRAMWTSSLKMQGEEENPGTYADYVKAVEAEMWTMTEEQWKLTQLDTDTVYKTHTDVLVDILMDIGIEEIDFDELPLRSQIAAIENMRGKIDACIESTLKSIKFMRASKDYKAMEGSKLVGLINSWDKDFRDMLDHPRYAHLTEFMYNYTPGGSKGTSPVTTRRVRARSEAKLASAEKARVGDKEAERSNAEDDLLAMKSDTDF